MNLIIIEDEKLSAERLRHLVVKIDDTIDVLATLSSVDEARSWFRDNSPPDLMLLDIQLSDGTAFDLLQSIHTFPGIIFTTAYDEYALKAFKYNSIEYLLKPIDKTELSNALRKFRTLNNLPLNDSSLTYKIENVRKSITGDYKRRFLIKIGEQFQNIEVNETAYIHNHNGSCILYTKDKRQLPIDYSLEQLEDILNPMDFFRINRQFLIKAEVIKEIHTYLNSRLLLKLIPEFKTEVIVSRDRVNDFKKWMDC